MAEQLATMMNTELTRIIRFIKSVPGWRDIHMEDQVFLIKGTLFLYYFSHSEYKYIFYIHCC